MWISENTLRLSNTVLYKRDFPARGVYSSCEGLPVGVGLNKESKTTANQLKIDTSTACRSCWPDDVITRAITSREFSPIPSCSVHPRSGEGRRSSRRFLSSAFSDSFFFAGGNLKFLLSFRHALSRMYRSVGRHHVLSISLHQLCLLIDLMIRSNNLFK